jgi:hypothetical protein
MLRDRRSFAPLAASRRPRRIPTHVLVFDAAADGDQYAPGDAKRLTIRSHGGHRGEVVAFPLLLYTAEKCSMKRQFFREKAWSTFYWLSVRFS